jgi:hypothetical protein
MAPRFALVSRDRAQTAQVLDRRFVDDVIYGAKTSKPPVAMHPGCRSPRFNDIYGKNVTYKAAWA